VSIEHAAQDTYPFWTGPDNQRWPVHLDDASTTASLIVSHSHLLDGIMASGSSYFAVSSRFCPLMTIRRTGDDAVAEPLRQLDLMRLTRLVSSHQHQSTVIKGQWSVVLCHPSPDLRRSVSDERIAPMPMHTNCYAAFFRNRLHLRCHFGVECSLAGPQSAYFGALAGSSNSRL